MLAALVLCGRAQVGRTLAEGERRSAAIFVRVTPKEKTLLEERALELDRSGASIVRHALLAFLNGDAGAAGAVESPGETSPR